MKRAGFRAPNASLVCNVGKCSISIVAIQNIATILSHKKVGKPVVVEISPYATESVSGSRHTGFFSDIGGCAVPVVAVQLVADGNASIVEITPIDEINILPAVTIEIGDADSRTKLLAINRDALIPFKVHKLDTSCDSYICELDQTWSRFLGGKL